MEHFSIEGGFSVSGSITPQGNKNEALPVICAALMCPHPVRIHNIPDIEDVRNLLKIARFLGAEIQPINGDAHSLEMYTPEIKNVELSEELTSPIRGAITLIAPVLARQKKVYMPRPGGDKIGRRRVDTHLLALEALGAIIEVSREGYLIKAEKLTGTEILLDEASVTGTENAVMAAAVAHGKTVIENAASEPHVQGLCHFLVASGVKIEGIGSNILTIYGVGDYSKLKSVEHHIGPDYLEVGSFISIAALTGGELTVKNIIPRDLRMIRIVFKKLGIHFEYADENASRTDLHIQKNQKLVIETDVHGEIPKLDDAPWPAFPADLISIALVTAVKCSGTVLIHEKLFESRLYFTDKLISMGAKIVLCDPHRAVIIGPSQLHAAQLTSPDIRAGMALVIAALAAQGTSLIQNILQIDRGYEKIDERLRTLGAKINRVIL
ncbi:MAG: UDP-N-acetylglucosamine 1-carboxyvinyltransferase [Spirochaetia bacterium]|nr:UDP-N-acetylglucosamine 1-carboxyvinyltransferase [Spirochaetia bacterium]